MKYHMDNAPRERSDIREKDQLSIPASINELAKQEIELFEKNAGINESLLGKANEKSASKAVKSKPKKNDSTSKRTAMAKV